MHRHDADFVALLVLFALDLRRLHLKRRDEGLQPWQTAGLEGEGKGQELVDDVAVCRWHRDGQ